MKVSSLLKGGIYEVSFGYNPKMEGYATLMSQIYRSYMKWQTENLIRRKANIVWR